jgi:hypothetical protein
MSRMTACRDPSAPRPPPPPREQRAPTTGYPPNSPHAIADPTKDIKRGTHICVSARPHATEGPALTCHARPLALGRPVIPGHLQPPNLYVEGGVEEEKEDRSVEGHAWGE